MAGPGQLEEIREQGSSNFISQLPLNPPSPVVSQVEKSPSISFREGAVSTLTRSPPTAFAEKPRPRRGSSVSHVDLDHFDPAGVQELRRTFTQASATQSNQNLEKGVLPSSASELTLAVGNGPFDLEKTLRKVVQKSAIMLYAPV